MAKTLIYPDIREMIEARAQKAEVALGQGEVTFMATAIDNFISDAIDKYIAGQREHGGSLLDRDCTQEAYKELIDGFWYNRADKHKQVCSG